MQDSVATVRELYDLFAAGNLPAVLAKFDPNIAWFEADGFPSVGGRHDGIDAVKACLIKVATDWEAMSVSPNEFFGDGDRVVVLGETTGKSRATGRSFKTPFAHAWRLHDGRAVEWRAYLDTAAAREAAIAR
jgi:uncharacterized protein